MSAPKLKLLRAAPAIHYQDIGRYGVAHHGFSQGGPLDLHAHCWANYLLENNSHCTALEISFGNASFLALEDTHFSLTGAEMVASIDGYPCENWSSHCLKKDQILNLNYASTGMHAYLAIKHGFLAPTILGSSSTVIRNRIGEHAKEGEILHSVSTSTATANPISHKRTPHTFLPDYRSSNVRVILPDAAPSNILNTTFIISQKSDRMGMHLIADPPLSPQPGIISEGTSLGAIQLLPDGNAIALLNDRQSQGGYAKIANIARVDLPILTQSQPGTQLRFEAVSLEQATAEWREFAAFFQL